MGFAPAEVAAGLRELLDARDLAWRSHDHTGTTVFELNDVVIRIGPLARPTLALFHPRTLLVLEGGGAVAESLKDAIRLKFLRVTG